MKYTHSLRNRILFTFCIFSFTLSMTYWLLLDVSMNIVEDMIFENRLRNEIAGFMNRYETDPETPLPHSVYIRSYIGLGGMPKADASIVRGLSEGLYETEGLGAIAGPVDYHIAIAALPGGRDLLYLFYNVGALRVKEQYEIVIRSLLLVIALTVTGLGGLFGALIAKRVIAPVTELAECVAQSEPDSLPMNLSMRFADDEIGLLARKLEQSMRRTHAFIQREQEFTRYVSHELRTPVTVIKGAVELLAAAPSSRAPHEKQIQRIARALRTIELTMETFLWFARGDSSNVSEESCDIAAVAREAFKEHVLLNRNKSIRAVMHAEKAPVVNAPPAAFRIVLDNLLRNAFSYTSQGTVQLHVNQYRLEVLNTACSPFLEDIKTGLTDAVQVRHQHKTQGHGLGLEIVQKLCARFHWKIEISSRRDKGTRITLWFQESAPQIPPSPK